MTTVLTTQEGIVPSLFSRYRPERVYCPSSIDNFEGFVTNLFRILRTGSYVTVFPLSEPSLLLISEHRDQLTPYLKLALPNHESLIKALDKSETIRIADEVGVPTPKTFRPRNIAEVKDISAEIQYPAVIKPRWSFVGGRNGKSQYSRPIYANSASEMMSNYSKVENFSPIIQEYVPGDNIQVGLLFDHGEPKAACFIKEHRTTPVTGGTSVLRESVPINPTLMKYALDLLGSLHWHGVAEVEFKVDSRDLTPKLMEINPRFWGSMSLGVQSGVDFPYLLQLLAER